MESLRDTWHRALVYFGLAEDPEYRYEEDDPEYYEPDTVSEEAAAPAPRRPRGGSSPSNVRRLRRSETRGSDDDIDHVVPDHVHVDLHAPTGAGAACQTEHDRAVGVFDHLAQDVSRSGSVASGKGHVPHGIDDRRGIEGLDVDVLDEFLE